jgi:hypothetical protein
MTNRARPAAPSRRLHPGGDHGRDGHHRHHAGDGVAQRDPSPRQDLQKEAQRLALLLQLARDEAIVRNRLVTFEATPERYHFLVRNETRWDADHRRRPAARARLQEFPGDACCSIRPAPAPSIRCASPSAANRSTSPSC